MALWKHQEAAVDFARAHRNVMFNMGMGTGKTYTTLHHLETAGFRKVLVVCPKAAINVWPFQIEKHNSHFTPLALKHNSGSLSQRVMKHSAPAIDKFVARDQPFAFIINYDVIWRTPMPELLRMVQWDAIVCDESHRIKSAGSKMSMAAFHLVRDFIKKGHRPQRIALTGTPMPHSQLDIYAQARFIDCSHFGFSKQAFMNRYAVLGGYGNYTIVAWKNVAHMQEVMSQFMFVARTEDVLDLPEYMDVTIPVEMSPATRRVYHDMSTTLVAEINGGIVNAANAMVKLLRLQQITSGFAPTEDGVKVQLASEKQAALMDIIEDIGNKEPIVVFCRFKNDIALVKEAAMSVFGVGYVVAERTGEKDEIAEFHSGRANMLVGNIASASEAVDLTRARYCIYYSHGLSLGNYLQSRARVHRPGQSRPVTYYHLAMKGTVDEKVMRAFDSKQEAIGSIIDAVKAGQEI